VWEKSFFAAFYGKSLFLLLALFSFFSVCKIFVEFIEKKFRDFKIEVGFLVDFFFEGTGKELKCRAGYKI